MRKLRKAFPLKKKNSTRVKQAASETTSKEASDEEDSENDSDPDLKRTLRCHKSRQKKLTKINLDEYVHDVWPFQFYSFFLPKYTYINVYSSYSVLPTDDVEEYLSDGMGYSDEDDENDIMDFARQKVSQPLWVLPFYALLPAHKQAKVNMSQRRLHFSYAQIID